MMPPELTRNAGNCALIVSNEGYDPWHLISFIYWACKTLITSAAYLKPLVFWSVIRSERCSDGLWRKTRCVSDWSTPLYQAMWQSLRHVTNRQDIEIVSDCSLETNHSSLNPEPAVICVWNEKHNSNVVHSFPDVWDPLQVMLNGLALIGQTIFSLSFHCGFSNRAINCLLVHRQNMHADMF